MREGTAIFEKRAKQRIRLIIINNWRLPANQENPGFPIQKNSNSSDSKSSDLQWIPKESVEKHAFDEPLGRRFLWHSLLIQFNDQDD